MHCSVSLAGLLTRVETGYACIKSAGYGPIKCCRLSAERGAGSNQSRIVCGAQDHGHAIMNRRHKCRWARVVMIAHVRVTEPSVARHSSHNPANANGFPVVSRMKCGTLAFVAGWLFHS